MSEAVHGVISLSAAVLCLNAPCEAVFHVAEGACPRCASVHFVPLAMWVPSEHHEEAKR